MTGRYVRQLVAAIFIPLCGGVFAVVQTDVSGNAEAPVRAPSPTVTSR